MAPQVFLPPLSLGLTAHLKTGLMMERWPRVFSQPKQPLQLFTASHTLPISYRSRALAETSFDASLNICGNIGKPKIFGYLSVTYH